MLALSKYLIPVYLVAGAFLAYSIIPDDPSFNRLQYGADLTPPNIKIGKSLVKIRGYGDDEQIYYTSDGSIPSVASTEYANGIVVDELPNAHHLLRYNTSPIWRAAYTPDLPVWGHVIRAVSYRNDYGHSIPVLRTAIKSRDSLRFQILSIAADEKDLFDFDQGIMSMGTIMWRSRPGSINTPWWDWKANYSKRGRKSDIDASIELLTPEGQHVYSENVRLRIHGNATRAFPQKSFRISSHKYLDNNKLKDPFNNGNSNRKSFIIRNSGNDWGISMFADAFMQYVSSELNVVTQRVKPIHVLINGCYWGIYNIRDRFDKNYLKQFGDGRVAVIEAENKLNEGKQKDFKDFQTLRNTVLSDISIDEKADAIRLSCDLQNLYDYFIVQTFFGNSDWPSNNNKVFRVGKKDKWKWLVYDLDYGLGYDKRFKPFEKILKHDGVLGAIFKTIIEDEELKTAFIHRYKFVLENTFHKDSLVSMYTLMRKAYKTEMPYQISRWRKPRNMAEWTDSTDEHINFLRQRSITVIKALNLLDGVSI